MFHAKDNKQGYIFEQFEYLGPKRLSELKNSWAGIFRIEILPELPVESLRKFYHNKHGGPSKIGRRRASFCIAADLIGGFKERIADPCTQIGCNAFEMVDVPVAIGHQRPAIDF